MKQEVLDLYQKTCPHGGQGSALVVTSGKGGVGKSNIAANIAMCLAGSGKSVLLFDADMGLGNLDIIMDIHCRYDISHVVSGRRRIEEVVHPGPLGLETICAGSGLDRLANLNDFQRHRLVQDLSRLQREHDTIVVDTAAGIGNSVVGFCLAADHVLVVTTPESTAIADAYAMIKVLVRNGFTGPISVVVNMARSPGEGKRTFRQIANVAKRFLDVNVYDAGVLLRDERVGEAVKMRRPVVLAYPRSQIASSLTALAARLSRGTATEQDRAGFWGKVVNWFS